MQKRRILKFLFVFVIIFAACKMIPANSTKPILNIKTDFGAKGDGVTNDHSAFQKAAAYITQSGGHCKLIIPQGTYKVGKQVKGKGLFYRGQSLFQLKNCNDVTIVGSNCLLKFKSGLYYGSFNPMSKIPYNSKEKVFRNGKYLASVGDAFSLRNCRDIEIKNIWVNGNNQSVVKGGKYGDKGIQASYSGLTIYDSKNIRINNCHFNYMGLDGIMIKNKIKNNPERSSDNINVLGTRCNYNGRQGISITGCIGLNLINCQFSNTGRAGIYSGPGAGVDLEGEKQLNWKILIEDCKIINNRGVGIVADNGDTKNVTIKNSIIWGTTQWSTWIKKPKFEFINCKIYGASVHGFNSPNRSLATKFINCVFTDTANTYGNYLVVNDRSLAISYINCTFKSQKKRIAFIRGRTLEKESMPLLKNCKIYVDLDFRKVGRDYIMILKNARYEDCKIYYSGTKEQAKGKRIESTNLISNKKNTIIYNTDF